MNKEELKVLLKELFLSDEISIYTNIVSVYAEKGSGRWNEVVTSLYIDDEEVYNHRGDVDILIDTE